MQRLILTIIAAFVMAIVFGPVVIPWLRRMKFGQTIYDLGPQSHKKKQGIPTMGGVIFAVPALIAALVFAQGESRWDFLLIAIVCAVGFGLAFNNIGTGIAASAAGVKILQAAVCTFLFSILFLILGVYLGDRIFGRVLGKYAPLISGILLIALGIIELTL